MNFSRLVVVLICFGIIFSICGGVVYALDQEEARVSVAWSNKTPNLDSMVTLSVLFISDSTEELTIYYFGLNFDWMDPDSFVGHDLSSDPIVIPPSGFYNFPTITVQIPADVSVGTHTYYVGVDGFQSVTETFSWNSYPLTFEIQGSGLEVYNTLVSKVARNITEATKAEYQSPQAQSLLDQAEDAYNQALSYASAENLDQAISALQNASIYLDQAEVEEKNYQAQNEQDPLLIIVGIGVAIVAVVVIIMILILRNRQKKIEPTDQTSEA